VQHGQLAQLTLVLDIEGHGGPGLAGPRGPLLFVATLQSIGILVLLRGIVHRSDARTASAVVAGATVLVNGAGGGVGIAAVQLARAAGLTVVGVASPAKHDLVRRFGGMPVAYGDGVLERVRAAAPGGVDGAFDLAGGAALRAIAGLVADRRRLLSVADRSLVVELGGAAVERDRSTTVLTELARLVEAGELDSHVTRVRPLEEAAKAVTDVERGHAEGKVVLVMPAGQT